MTKFMLIDAAHSEETRVAVVDGNRIEELDFESQSHKQLRGNIYLAKVTRVEPSLQAAFIEYGGNRHGFLAFNEIHPDYYQIPVADREALMRAELDDRNDDPAEDAEDGEVSASGEDDDEDDLMERELERRRRRLMRRYKIQEVIKRRQIMLVQVVKEERGNKGAALTTYLSLAGRYGVLMPNTARGGGISRKITNATDRKRLKSAAQSLELPPGMGLIIRTAGAARTKAEIKRDYEYLLRLWENIRETTLRSIAPALIYEEEDLVKRSIRDMYDKDLDGILVEGEAGFREARDFMRMIMPSQAKKIQPYRERTPLFVNYKIEDQISQIHSPVVPLRSGGYLVINQTEALVAIDVNSGKSTRERNVEATALKTNMEAAAEAARQLRLRDLAGLIVIDFIDMDEGKNNRAVEKELKDCLATDRARIQMGKISGFGLMEISRQRRRSGVLEGSTHVCEHCHGAGRVRSVESSALSALRAIELEGGRGGAGTVIMRLPTAVALYILNEKRPYLIHIETMHGLKVAIAVDDVLAHAEHAIERTETREDFEPPAMDAARTALLSPLPDAEDDYVDPEEDEDDEDIAQEALVEVVETEADVEEIGERGRGRGRRRRVGARRDEGPRPAEADDLDARAEPSDVEAEEDEGEEGGPGGASADGELDASGQRPRRRRRGRRGGRRVREEGEAPDVYAWVAGHPETPHAEGDDPYVWHDAHARPARSGYGYGPRELESATTSSVPAASTPRDTESTASAASAAAPTPDVYGWSGEDAPPPREGGRGRRRPRGRGRGRGSEPGQAFADADPGELYAVAPGDSADIGSMEVGPTAAVPAPTAAYVAVEMEGVREGSALSEPTRVETATAPGSDDPREIGRPDAMMNPPVSLAMSEEQATPAAIEPALDAEPGIAPPPPPEPDPAEVDVPPESTPEPAIAPPPPPVAVSVVAVSVAAVPVAAAAEPDPAEVSGPPPAPKRGWWRLRG